MLLVICSLMQMFKSMDINSEALKANVITMLLVVKGLRIINFRIGFLI